MKLPVALLAALALALPLRAAELSADALARLIAGRDATALGAAAQPALEVYARKVTESWAGYDARIGTPLRQWAAVEVDAARGETVFYPFSGPDFPTLHLLHPGASRYILVAIQNANLPPDLTRVDAASLQGYLERMHLRLDQYARLGFFRTDDLNRDAARGGLLVGVTDQLMGFASRIGYEVASVEPIRLRADGSDVEPVPGAPRDAAAWRSVRLTLKSAGRSVTLDYVRGDLSDAGLQASPPWKAFIEAAARHRTVFKAASHLPQQPQFSLIRAAVLARAPSIVQDETGIDYGLLATAYDVTLYGKFDRAHRLFSATHNQALAAAYASRDDVRPLGFRVGYEKRLGSSVQVAVRREVQDAAALERRVAASLERYAARPRVVYVSHGQAGTPELRAWLEAVSAKLPAAGGASRVVSIMLDRSGAVVDASVDRGVDKGVGDSVRRLQRLPVPPASVIGRADMVVLTMNLK